MLYAHVRMTDKSPCYCSLSKDSVGHHCDNSRGQVYTRIHRDKLCIYHGDNLYECGTKDRLARTFNCCMLYVFISSVVRYLLFIAVV